MKKYKLELIIDSLIDLLKHYLNYPHQVKIYLEDNEYDLNILLNCLLIEFDY